MLELFFVTFNPCFPEVVEGGNTNSNKQVSKDM